MGWASTAGDAIPALVTIFTAALAADAIPVIDGEPVSPGYPAVVVVGWDGGKENDAVTAEEMPEGLASQPDRDRYVIHNYLGARDGGGSMTKARTQAMAMLAACGQAIAADGTLGGKVMQAMTGEWALSQFQDESGAVAQIVFGVACDAFTKR